MFTASPGHYGPRTGASGYIDEVTEAIKVTKEVVRILRASNFQANYVEDNVSKTQSANIGWLVSQHNKTKREFDISIHFNASAGTHERGIGTEVLYVNPAVKGVAEQMSAAITKASGLINRGAKSRSDLGFLNGTHKKALLIEVCFVNSKTDVELYRKNFDAICHAIASELARAVGKTLTVTPPKTAVETAKPSTENKGARKLDINSPALRDLIEGILASKAQREILVNYAIAEGMNKSWLEKLENRTITEDEILALAAVSVVNSFLEK